MRRTILHPLLLLLATHALADSLTWRTSAATGAIESLRIAGDTTAMEWTLRTDGQQYAWVTARHGWGLGYFTLDGRQQRWEKPTAVKGATVTYKAGGIEVTVSRRTVGGDMEESYTFRNTLPRAVQLTGIGINTPYNDNYPDATTCMTRRCHTHIWAEGAAAWVYATRMGGSGTALGLAVTEGELRGYDIRERGRKKDNSNFRGVISLAPNDMTLAAGQSRTVVWRVFACRGWDDFKARLVKLGSVWVTAPKYVFEQGEKATVAFQTAHGTKQLHPSTAKLGSEWVTYNYAKGKQAKAQILVIPKVETLLKRRAEFIVAHQQMRVANDNRRGAYMVYDNEGDSIYLNDTKNCNPVDRDEGRERVGMGVFLARMQQRYPQLGLQGSLTDYARFVRRLQTNDYTTYSNTRHEGWNRNYNYSWVATFYFEMYRVSGERRYLLDAYHTLRALFRQFCHGFYAIDIPTFGVELLRREGFTREADTLLADLRQVADAYAATGLRYPKSEVNYEQAIVAPSAIHLLRMYLLTHEARYREAAERLMPALEAFGGRQPSFHLHDIALRHWDGYWFGKREMWGDTMPHYWSTLTAEAFALYAEATGKRQYADRARSILLSNLCLFTPDGRGSCAYIYPRTVDGQHGELYDPYANDQDWALCEYLSM